MKILYWLQKVLGSGHPADLRNTYQQATSEEGQPPVVDDDEWERIRAQAIAEAFDSGKTIVGRRRLPEDPHE